MASVDPKALIERMFAGALAAVEPSRAVATALGRIGLETEGGKIVILAIGKAAEAMAIGAAQALGDSIDAGYVVTKDGHLTGGLDERFYVVEAAHPVPDQRGVTATRAVIDAVRALDATDTVVALISGGGSALFEAPRSPLELSDIAALTSLMLQAGAPIQDLNTVRIPLSMVKGGGLRSEIRAGKVVTLILSDVLGNDFHLIASGPTVPGGSNPRLSQALLRKYDLEQKVPRGVIEVLRAGQGNDEPVDTTEDILEIVGDNAMAVEAARSVAEREGLHAEVLWSAVEGEASVLGRDWVEVAQQSDADVLLGGGEATVTVLGGGSGGRNTEFALASAIEMDRQKAGEWTMASLATDGQDALTGAAGAIVDASVVEVARQLGLDPVAALQQNDSATLLSQTGSLVFTGPTGTNVNDLYFAVRQGS